MKQNISCRQAVDYISKKEEGKLSLRQRFQLWKHLVQCSLCHTFSRQNKLIIKAFSLKKEDSTVLLTEQQKQEIVEAVLHNED